VQLIFNFVSCYVHSVIVVAWWNNRH